MHPFFAHFLSVYFWVYGVSLLLTVLIFLKEGAPKTEWRGLNFWGMVGLTLWIISFGY